MLSVTASHSFARPAPNWGKDLATDCSRSGAFGLLALEWSAVLFTGRRFSHLDREGRLRHVHRIEGWRILAPLGEVWTAVRGLAAASFYTHGEVAERLGYAHQAWIDAKVKERRERFGAPEPW